ncbi:hypothetical protein [Amycolatopsis sp. NPDC051128]|uniref:hypothetical protein n=1 Tax=Amycolatopsis sp. NPDC051128 TaxID=3155412 RepID=UPI00343A44E5
MRTPAQMSELAFFVGTWHAEGRQRSAYWDGDWLVFLGTVTMGGHTVPLRETVTRVGRR